MIIMIMHLKDRQALEIVLSHHEMQYDQARPEHCIQLISLEILS